MNKMIYINYGCGLSAPDEWHNFDASPTLKLQRLPLVGILFKKVLKPRFPSNIKYGDIIIGLPKINDNSVDGVYCSHVLEHLAYNEMIKAIENTYKILKPGGIFRLVMPDFENLIDSYLERKKQKNSDASIIFMRNTGMALENRQKSIKAVLSEVLGNSRHQWLWDEAATIQQLKEAGFSHIRRCEYNDSKDPLFKLVENIDRFKGAIALEAIK